MTAYQTRIASDPAVRGGRPCIRGMRITVHDVLAALASAADSERPARIAA